MLQHPDLVVCGHCKKEVVKTYLKKSGRFLIYTDEHGNRWSGGKCPECYKKYKVKYDAKRRLKQGFTPIGATIKCEICGKERVMIRGRKKQCCQGNT